MENPKKQNLKNQPVNTEDESYDPFIGLKYIAYHRSVLGGLEDVKTDDELLQNAKWQICKARNILFKDPIFDTYSAEELMIEFFTIQFDENEEAKEAFKLKMQGKTKPAYEWFDDM